MLAFSVSSYSTETRQASFLCLGELSQSSLDQLPAFILFYFFSFYHLIVCARNVITISKNSFPVEVLMASLPLGQLFFLSHPLSSLMLVSSLHSGLVYVIESLERWQRQQHSHYELCVLSTFGSDFISCITTSDCSATFPSWLANSLFKYPVL